MERLRWQRIRRLSFALGAIFFAVTIAACGNMGEKAAANDAATSVASASSGEKGNDKPLVIYFSRGINTDTSMGVDAVAGPSLKADGEGFRSDEQVLAEWIAEETKGDLFAIRTARKYPVGYDDILEAGKQEKLEDARPALSSRLENLHDYRTIYFVYPNWWGDLPMPVYSFFDTYDFSGKKIIAVVISGGGGFAGTVSYIQHLEPNAEVVEGIEIYKRDMDKARERIASWLRSEK